MAIWVQELLFANCCRSRERLIVTNQSFNMLAVVLLLLLSVLCRINGEIISITQHPRNDTFCVGSTASLSCTVYNNDTNNAADNIVWFRGANPISNMINNTRNGDIVTSVLTIDNVSLSDNGTGYFCLPKLHITSYIGVVLITDLPGGITDINISPDTITACSFVVQWIEPSRVCGTVWYTVTISTEEGILIITDNTTMTNYNVSGLNNNTVYHVNVTASNNAGSSDPNGTSVITNSIEPVNISVMQLNSTSFIVNWTISDPSYNYTVILTNLSTGVTNSSTVPESANSYTVAGLGGNTTYNVSVSVMDVCGMTITSDTITVNITEEIPTDGSSLATSTSADNKDDDDSNSLVVIIAPVISVISVVAVVILVTITLCFLWNRKNKKKSKKKSDLETVPKVSNYSEPFKDSSALQGKSNAVYSYATTGPRRVTFPTNSV